MSSDVYVVRNPDGSEFGPCSRRTIAVLIDEQVITPDADVWIDGELVPITSVDAFAEAFGERTRRRPPPPTPTGLGEVLFTSDLTGGEGAAPLAPEGFGDLGSETVFGGITDILGEDQPIVDPWFAGLLTALWRNQETAILDVEARGVTTEIYLVRGTPVFAKGGTIEDTLGRLLVRMGRISEEQLEQAVDHLIERQQVANKRIGEVLVELQMITPHEIAEALQIQTREKILSCFAWTELTYVLRRDDSFVKEIPRFDCRVPPLVLEGVRRHYDADRIDQVLGSARRRFPALTESAEDVAQKFELGPEGRRFLDAFGGDQILEIIQSSAKMGSLESGRFIAALITSGALDVRIEPAPKKSSAPPVATDRGTADAEPPSAKTGAAVSGVRSLWAEAAFKLGKRVAATQPAVALEKFEKAAELRPDAVEYRMLAAFTRYRIAKTGQERGEQADRARRLAEEALAQDKKVASAHKILGHFDKLEKKYDSALGHFKRALELNAWDKEARLEFRLLKSKQPG